MAGTAKIRITYKKLRLVLFVRTYAYYRISQYIGEKYRFDNKLKSKELRTIYFKKKAIPEISRLSKALNLPYNPLWESIVLDKTISLSKNLPDREIKVYLSVEHELTQFAIAKQSKSDYTDPEYEFEFALLRRAIERTTGNRLRNIKNDSVFEQQLEILQKLYLGWYYKTAYKYKLPTLRIVPFILRLIS